MTTRTRKPTGKAPWPILLLAGVEKSGKSYAAAALSGSELVDRTFWIEIGEGSADQYGSLGRYEIVEHDGTYDDMLAAARWAVEQARGEKPNAIVVDSMTELWDLLCAEQETIAKKRGKDTITMDQWNAAKKRWRRFFDVFRPHRGPVIMTARFEQVAVVEGGRPKTKDGRPGSETVKEWKVRAEKNIGFEVDGTIQIPKPRTYFLTGMRSLKFDVPVGGWLSLPAEFNLDWFLRELGIDDSSLRTYVAPAEGIASAERDLPKSRIADELSRRTQDQADGASGEAHPSAADGGSGHGGSRATISGGEDAASPAIPASSPPDPTAEELERDQAWMDGR